MFSSQPKLIVAAICSLFSCALVADDTALPANKVTPSQMVQGGVGLWQTPTARMMPEGNFAINYTDNDEYRFWSVSLQLFPWMEATARYTDVRTRLYSQDVNFSGDQTLKDKGLDVKFRLWEESYYLPDVSVGFRDFGGTGFFESEFVTMSKSAGPFDFHVGMGWGYLGNSGNITNPFCRLRDSFCSRPLGYSGNGGKIDYQQFFKGNASIFGGVEYRTPIDNLTLKLEYEGNNYQFDRAGQLQQDTAWNVGAVYRWKALNFSLNYQRGNTVGFGVSYQFDMNTVSMPKFDKPARTLAQAKPAGSLAELNRQRLYNDLAFESGFILKATDITDTSATFYGSQIAYRDKDVAAQRVGRILASELPDSIETYHIVESADLIPMVDTQIDASEFKAAAKYESLEPDIEASITRHAPSEEILAAYKPNTTSGFGMSTDFFWTQTFGSPEDFYLYQGGLIVSGGYKASKTLGIYGSLRATLFENFDKFNYTVDKDDTPLPRVRTYVREYVSGSAIKLDTAYLSWSDRLKKDWYAQVYAGYLEAMYGGVGGEIMYRPVDSNLAYGLDINYVKQRSYEDNTSFFDYTAVTGFASVYWKPSFLPDTQLVVSAGQFLAKDKGVNIDFAKRFDSGIIIGAYAAFTNVSADEYGEGSFTKGFYISLPMDLFVLRSSKGRGTFPWVPISRDGGQMLNRPVRLIDKTEILSPFYD